MDVVLQSHQEVARSNAVCGICHTRYARDYTLYKQASHIDLSLSEDVAQVSKLICLRCSS